MKHIHHFTKLELAAEEIIVIVLICGLGLAAWAAEAIMPIRANIVRCVTQEERVQMCEERSLCCGLVDESMVDPNNPESPRATGAPALQQSVPRTGTYFE